MPTPLLETKLWVPRPRGGLVPRPRLMQRLHHGASSPLVLVSAPAGFGKTTLLAGWLADDSASPTGGHSAAWLSLDRSDSDPVLFWRYVVAAMRTVAPAAGAVALALLDGPAPSPVHEALTSLLNDLGALERDVVLVLDDYHVIESTEVHDELAFLVDHLPPRLHLVIASRADPAMALARLRARGDMVEVRAPDLRFTRAEVTAYLTGAMRLPLTTEQVSVLEERTEGWIAALQLAALSLQGRDDPADFIAGFAGDDRYIVDYLVEEVVQRQPEHVQTFLLRTSILGRLSGSLCDTVTGQDGGGAMLDTLERGNLFLVPLDDRRSWYRYHHLFADVLHARLISDHPDLVPDLHKQASGWFATRGLVADAVRHALAAEDFDRAAYLIEEALPELRRTRQDGVLLTWMRSLPEYVVRRRPVLSILSSWSRLVAGDLYAAESRLDDAEAALVAGAHDRDLAASWADTDDLRTAPATISVYRASLAQARGDVAGTVGHARHAVDLAGSEDHLVRGAGAGFLGLASWAAGDVDEALATFSEAVRSLHAAGNLVDELDSTVVIADMCVAAGRPSRARRLYEQALQTATGSGEPYPRATADLHVGLAELDRELDDLESAEAHLETARVLGERASITENRHRWYVAMAQARAAGGDHRTATDLLDRAEALYRRGFYPDVRPIAAIRTRVRIADGDLSAAAGWAHDSGVTVDDDPDYLREYEHLTLARLLLAQHRAAPHGEPSGRAAAVTALPGLLDRLHTAATDAGREGSVVEIRVLKALALHAHGDQSRALVALGSALVETPEPESWVRLYLDEGDTMLALLHDAAGADREQDEAVRRHARRILDRARSPADLAEPSASLVDPLSHRELQVLRLLDSDLSGPEIARQLYVTLNTLRTHTKHIFTKLDVTNRAAAVRRGHERGML